MTEPTRLDLAHARMEAMPEDHVARLAFYGCLADSELFVPVRDDAADPPEPVVFHLEDGDFVMTFDSEERMTSLTGRVTPHAVLIGRVLVRALAGRHIGIGLNLGVAQSSFQMSEEAVDWLAERLAAETAEYDRGRIVGLWPIEDIDEGLIDALASRFAGIPSDMTALLVRAVRDDNTSGPLLLVTGARPADHAAFVRAAAEAAAFAGSDASLSVAFMSPDDLLARQAGRVGRILNGAELSPEPQAAYSRGPGTDPDRPPKLR